MPASCGAHRRKQKKYKWQRVAESGPEEWSEVRIKRERERENVVQSSLIHLVSKGAILFRETNVEQK